MCCSALLFVPGMGDVVDECGWMGGWGDWWCKGRVTIQSDFTLSVCAWICMCPCGVWLRRCELVKGLG